MSWNASEWLLDRHVRERRRGHVLRFRTRPRRRAASRTQSCSRASRRWPRALRKRGVQAGDRVVLATPRLARVRGRRSWRAFASARSPSSSTRCCRGATSASSSADADAAARARLGRAGRGKRGGSTAAAGHRHRRSGTRSRARRATGVIAPTEARLARASGCARRAARAGRSSRCIATATCRSPPRPTHGRSSTSRPTIASSRSGRCSTRTGWATHSRSRCRSARSRSSKRTRPPTPAVVAEIVRQHQPTLFFGIPAFYAALNASDIADDTFRSVRLGRLGRRVASRRDVASVPRSLRRRDPRRHRLDRDDAHLPVEPRRRGAARHDRRPP